MREERGALPGVERLSSRVVNVLDLGGLCIIETKMKCSS